MEMATQNGRDPNTSDGLLDRLVGGIIQVKSRYKSDIRPVAGGDTLPPVLASSELEHPEDSVRVLQRGERPPRPRQQLLDMPILCSPYLIRAMTGMK